MPIPWPSRPQARAITDDLKPVGSAVLRNHEEGPAQQIHSFESFQPPDKQELHGCVRVAASGTEARGDPNSCPQNPCEFRDDGRLCLLKEPHRRCGAQDETTGRRYALDVFR